MFRKRKFSKKRTTSKGRAMKRSYKGRTFTSRKRSYKTFRRSKKYGRRSFKGGPTRFHTPKVTAKRYVNVSRDIIRERGYFKLTTMLQTASRALTATDASGLSLLGSYWVAMGSIYNPFETGCSTDISGLYVPPRGMQTDMIDKFRRSMVLAQRLTCTVERLDSGGSGGDNWEVLITPVRPQDIRDYAYPIVPGAPFPGIPNTSLGQYRTQSEHAQTKKKTLWQIGTGNKYARTSRVSSTVHMKDMVLDTNFKTKTQTVVPLISANVYTKLMYEESHSSSPTYVDADRKPYWNVSIYRKGATVLAPTPAVPATWNIQFHYTWWVKAYDPKPNYLLLAPHPDTDVKEEKKEHGSDGPDDEPDLDAFQDLTMEPPPEEKKEEKKMVPVTVINSVSPPPTAVKAPPKPPALSRSLTNVGLVLKR